MIDWQDNEPFIGPSPKLPEIYHREPAIIRKDQYGNLRAFGTGVMNNRPKITKEPAVQALFADYIRRGLKCPPEYYGRGKLKTHAEWLKEDEDG